MFQRVRRLIAAVLSRFRPFPPPEEEPSAGVREPRVRNPGGRSSAIALAEPAYRGVVLGALDTALGAGRLPVALQAVAFGTLHFEGGIPRGPMGVGLAVVYGLALGELRHRTGGLLAPWIVHVATDLVIFSIVLTLGRAWP